MINVLAPYRSQPTVSPCTLPHCPHETRESSLEVAPTAVATFSSRDRERRPATLTFELALDSGVVAYFSEETTLRAPPRTHAAETKRCNN